MADKKQATGEAGWTEAEKTPDPAGQERDAPAGEAEPKGRPTSDREATETAAARTAPAPQPAPPRRG